VPSHGEVRKLPVFSFALPCIKATSARLPIRLTPTDVERSLCPMTRGLLAVSWTVLSLLCAGCGPETTYELHWTIGCPVSDLKSCALTSVRQCSVVGLDAVEVQVLVSSAVEETSVFPCYSYVEGAVGRGPGLDPGPVTLKSTGLTPGGTRITGPVSLDLQIADDGLTEAWIDLPTPAQCADGVDNDLDGHVDLQDPGCEDGRDTDESR
jgi:hypothetical protein